MDLSTWVLFGLIALLATNHLVIRTPWARNNPPVFWAVNFVDIILGAGVLVFGLPGFEDFQAVSWVVGLLLVAHVAQNMQLRAMWSEEDRQYARAEREEERKRMRQEREELEGEADA